MSFEPRDDLKHIPVGAESMRRSSEGVTFETLLAEAPAEPRGPS